MIIRHVSLKRLTPLAFAMAVALGGAAYAADQPSASPSLGSLEEVIVTGTKRDVASQSVPITISAISESDLANSHVNDVKALATLAPGLVLSNSAGFNSTGGGMRGTGTNTVIVTQDAPVSFLMDDFVLAQVTSQFVSLFDTQQIEVYRGPQGTLFGASTTGGVISITSRKPELGKYYNDSELNYGQYENGANLASVKTAINLPISDTIAVRVAAMYDYDAGFYTNDKRTATFPNNVPLWGLFGIPAGTPVDPSINTNVYGNGSRIGGRNVLAAKAKLLWVPNDRYQALLMTEIVHDTSGSPPGVNESGPTDLLPLLGFPGIGAAHQSNVFSTLISGNPNIDEGAGHRVDVQGLYLHQTFNTDIGEFKSITGYRQEQTRLPSTYTGEAFLTLFDSTRNTDRWTMQQEFRFASKFAGPFNFVAGANYNHDSFDFIAYYSVGLVALLPNLDPTTGSFVNSKGYVNLNTEALNDAQFQGTQQSRKQKALFWDGTYNVTDKVTFTAGVRYTQDHKDFLRFVDGGGPCNSYTTAIDIEAQSTATKCYDAHSNFISRAGIPPSAFNGGVLVPFPLSAFGTVVDTSGDWSKTTYRAVLDYKPATGQMAYLSYSTGFLSGGFSETCATVSRCKYDPETNSNLELGYKADLLDNTLRLNLAAYLTDYKNLQRAVVAAYRASDGTGQQETVTVNTGASRATGLDLEAVWVPTHELRVDAALNYMHNEYLSGEIPDLINVPPGPTNQLSKYLVPFSPKWKANLGVSYDLGLASGAHVTLHGDANYQAEAETDVYNTINTQMQARTVLNVSAAYHDEKGRWSVTPWIANVGNKIYRVAALPVAGLWNFTNYGAPRSYGVTANFRFE